MWLNEVDDIDDPCIEELENDNFDRLGCALTKAVLSVLNGVEPLLFGCGLGLLKANERMLSTPPEERTRLTKHVKLSMKNFLSFLNVWSTTT